MATTKNEYREPLIEAANQVLLEVTRLLYEYRDGIVVVGGLVPGLLFSNATNEHIGSIDVDLALNAHVLKEEGYRTIKESLLNHGYETGKQPFIFHRKVKVADQVISVEVDFLSGEYGGTAKNHRTQEIQDMRPRKARACDLAFFNPTHIFVKGQLPDGGGRDQVSVNVASVVPFLIMKAETLVGRIKEKDAYDIYYCLTNYPGGMNSLIEAFRAFPSNKLVKEGLEILAEKFASVEHSGPVSVTTFLGETDSETIDFIRRDAYERMQFLLEHLMGRPSGELK